MTTVDTVAPTMPARLRALYDVSPDEMRVTFKSRQFGSAIFLSLWLVMWTAGCVFLAVAAIRERDVFTILFGCPFWASWFFVTAILIGMLTRRQELLLDVQGLAYHDRAIVRLNERHVPRDELRGFAVKRQPKQGDSDTPPQIGLEIRTAGQPLFLFAGLPEAELEWLAHELSQLVDTRTAPTVSTVPRNEASSEASNVEVVYPQRLSAARYPVEPPSDCDWEMDRQFAVLAFVHRGHWSWGAVLVMLFINLFWNGIVGVFVSGLFGFGPNPPGGEWWFLFFFLIPFEAIGLAVFGAFLVLLLEPVRQIVWSFDARQIACRWQWLGAGHTWTYPVEGLDRIDLVREKDEGEPNRSLRPSQIGAWAGTTPFGLSFVARGNRELCQIDGLTEGEARYIADTVLRQRPEWFSGEEA